MAGFIRSAVTSLRVPPVVIGAVAGAVLVGLAVAALVAARRSEPPPAVAPPSAPVAAVERPRALSTEAQIAARRLEAFAAPSTSEIAEAAPPAAGFEMAFRAQPPFDAIDSVLFDTLRQRLKLHGVVPVGRNEICLAEDGRRFACGLMARATLQNHIAGKEPTCERAFLAEDARAEMLEVRCSVDGEDLALHMIRAGFAFPALHAGAHHFEALAEAKARRAGVWAGPYEPALEDRSRDDSRATPFGSTRVRSPSPSEAGTTLPALMKPNGNARPLPRGPEGAGGGVQPPWAKSQ
ncbi:hypothetical protein EYW49_02345 [Siculibacillus lacustris]|uniref:TNase-like domain-containing protein n=1 Tax=Siculibacillus lacustris TaxID=1549641 RepID=A0A4Q9VZT2_9HYPH|nr:hypothetical protein [Siculibacillus lacustris]TBW41014.1 hypothetical protein EYW49_02345 [Siculibacillus lacustris]